MQKEQDISYEIENQDKKVYVSRKKIVNKRTVCEVHCHDAEYELYYMLDGGTTYFIEEEIFRINKGDFVLIPKGVWHSTDNQHYSHNERILVAFGEELFSERTYPVLKTLTDTPVISVPDARLPELEELLFKLEAEYQQQKMGRKIMLDIYVQELLVLLYRYKCERKSVVRESDKIIYTISDYICKNYAQDITLKGLSKAFSISEGYLSRKFKEVSGLGINQYITYVRISHAEKFLKESSLSVTEIAEKCGFCGSTYFSSVFHKMKGVSPLTFRKNSHHKK